MILLQNLKIISENDTASMDTIIHGQLITHSLSLFIFEYCLFQCFFESAGLLFHITSPNQVLSFPVCRIPALHRLHVLSSLHRHCCRLTEVAADCPSYVQILILRIQTLQTHQIVQSILLSARLEEEKKFAPSLPLLLPFAFLIPLHPMHKYPRHQFLQYHGSDTLTSLLQCQPLHWHILLTDMP